MEAPKAWFGSKKQSGLKEILEHKIKKLQGGKREEPGEKK